jgi:hypothetical protein
LLVGTGKTGKTDIRPTILEAVVLNDADKLASQPDIINGFFPRMGLRVRF